MELRPVNDQVVVKRLSQEETTKSGLYVPEAHRGQQAEAEVLAVGRGRVTESGAILPLAVAVGDTVLLGEWAGTEVTLDGDDLLVVREDQILAVVER